MKVDGQISQLESQHEILHGDRKANQTGSEKTFFNTFEKVFEETDRNLKNADEAVLKANSGGNVGLHDMMIAMEKADISLRLLVQFRNKAVEAYNEIMRMQV